MASMKKNKKLQERLESISFHGFRLNRKRVRPSPGSMREGRQIGEVAKRLADLYASSEADPK